VIRVNFRLAFIKRTWPELGFLVSGALGRSNAAIASELAVSEGTVEKHVASIFTKLDLPESPSDHRRVLAVLRFLDS